MKKSKFMLKLKHIGYLLLIGVILVNLYYYISPAIEREGPLAPGNFISEWQDEEHVVLFEMDAGNRYVSTLNLYYLQQFIIVIFDVIAIAFALALIVHPSNKR